MKKKTKNKKRNLTDVIGVLAVVGGMIGMIYTCASDFENEKSQTRSMASSCMSALIGGLVISVRDSKQR